MFNISSLGVFNKNINWPSKAKPKPISQIIEEEIKSKISANPPSAPIQQQALKASKPLNPFAMQPPPKAKDFPVSKITDKSPISDIAQSLGGGSIKIGGLGKTSGGSKPIKSPTTPTTPTTPPPPPPPPTTAKYDIFTMDSSIGYSYDLDKDGIAETTHHDGVTTGLKMSVSNANVIPKLVDLSNSSEVLAGLQEGIRLAQGTNLQAGESKTDAAYFPLGVIISTAELEQMVGMSNLNYTTNTSDPAYSTSLNNPQFNKTVRDQLMASSTVSSTLKQQISSFEEMAKYIPVYISAGNDPNKFNLWSLAQGSNINIIGSESSYSSLVYDKKVATDYWWTVKSADANGDGILDKGWDLDGNGTLDRVLKAGDEGYDLANDTKSYIYGGTSLGVGIAIGKDISNGLIIDRELNIVA